jgi:hypothetical protein
MRRFATIFLLALMVTMLGLTKPSSRNLLPAEIPVTIYDSNPSHLWNRLYAALRVRQDRQRNRIGEDSLDPPLWSETEHLLSEPSHEHVMGTLDEFLQRHGETLLLDPVKRAMMQRDLWAVFDWSVAQFPSNGRPGYDKQKRELQMRLAAVLRRLALTPNAIQSLPNNYAEAVAAGAFAKEYDPAHPDQPFLPPDLFDPHGSWAGISPSPESDGGVAPMHNFNFSGRSSFRVFVRLPGGHKATMDYFRTLWNFPQPWIQAQGAVNDDQTALNPDLPSFPAGTEVALVRSATLIDNQGNLAASSITESVQIRVYHTITRSEERNFGNGNMADIVRNTGQYFYEIRLSRPQLFSGKNGGLRALGRDEREFLTFQSKGDDPIEEPGSDPRFESNAIPELQGCIFCHFGGGVRSLNSRESLLRPHRMQKDPENSDYGSIYGGDNSAIEWKQNHFDWGLLNGYWKAAPLR